MKALFFIGLVLLMLFLIYGKEGPKFHDFRQFIPSVLTKQDDTTQGKKENTPEVMPAEDPVKTPLQTTTGDPGIDKELHQANSEQTLMLNPFVEKLLNMQESDLDIRKKLGLGKRLMLLHSKINEINDILVSVFFISAVAILLSMVFVRYTSFSGIGLLLAKLGFKISRIIIFLIALTAVIVWVGYRYNFFGNVSSMTFCSLMVLLISSAAALKLYDYNNPVWNRMFFSLIWPIASEVIIHVT